MMMETITMTTHVIMNVMIMMKNMYQLVETEFQQVLTEKHVTMETKIILMDVLLTVNYQLVETDLYKITNKEK